MIYYKEYVVFFRKIEQNEERCVILKTQSKVE